MVQYFHFRILKFPLTGDDFHPIPPIKLYCKSLGMVYGIGSTTLAGVGYTVDTVTHDAYR